MKVLRTDNKKIFEELKKRHRVSHDHLKAVETRVRGIINTVRTRGDKALLDYTACFDGVKLTKKNLQVSKAEIETAWRNASSEDKKSLNLAKKRIEKFHCQELTHSWKIAGSGGEALGQKVVPLEKVGIYVPGGKASYPSSVLMSAIPAHVAGVSEIIMVTPPSPKGINLFTLVAARICGIKKIFKVGGAQAIAALAYGTETIPQVDKIVGPGNIFVALAKKMVSGEVGIDMIAGPSEILVIADGSARPEFIAADLLSQAEHDEEAQVILMTPSQALAARVQDEINLLMEKLPRKEILRKALKRYGLIIITKNISDAVALSNKVAPEHLLLAVKDPYRLLEKVKNAGSVFLGHFSPVAAGDYLAGPNHVLPTSGTARFSSPLGVYDFVKFISFTHLNQAQLKKLGNDIMRLARIEGLEAHARSVELRLSKPR
ncbi:MAG: histidinol dehydrogenase [Thermodesulfobacteriota bacterium]|jgi:histidinol dehydrogenase|nr:MAG: histidinol dehydrogenase [Thermodesulfobacteriota bacterium]